MKTFFGELNHDFVCVLSKCLCKYVCGNSEKVAFLSTLC